MGDVGFGKTEVAVRAIFRVAASGKQAVLLAPTTVLARQHYKLLQERLSPFGMKVVSVARSTSVLEKAKVLEALASGEADVAVGTHSLLAPSVR